MLGECGLLTRRETPLDWKNRRYGRRKISRRIARFLNSGSARSDEQPQQKVTGSLQRTCPIGDSHHVKLISPRCAGYRRVPRVPNPILKLRRVLRWVSVLLWLFAS